MLFLWGVSIIGTVLIAVNKNRSIVGWFFLSFFFGPIALILAILVQKIEPSQEKLPSQYTGISLNSIKAEFEDLKKEFNVLAGRLNNLGVKISALETGDAKQPEPEPEPKPEPEPAVEVPEKPKEPIGRKGDIEMNLGKFWLSKIGIVIFSLGVAFLITYTFARFGPAAKILFGYLIAAALFIAGIKLEKTQKFINYGRVLLGGGWAIAYFTTYAMYHFEASRIISSQLLDLFLLAVVALGIIAHSLKYKSEALTAVAIIVGYLTSVLGDVGYFTLVNASLLALVTLFLVYKMQWVRFIFIGVILTYLVHFAWVIKQISFSMVPAGRWNVENVYFSFDAGFLLIYWLLFTAAVHLIRDNASGSLSKKLAVANFSNFILFFFMLYPKFYAFYPQYKFNVVLGLGLAYAGLAITMELAKRDSLFISNIIIAVSLLTLAVPLKLLPYHTMVFWFIELPFLLFAGFIFKRRVYRYIGFGLSVVLFLRFNLGYWRLLHAFLSFSGFLSTAACFVLYRYFQDKKDTPESDKPLDKFYSAFACVYLTVYLQETVSPLWLTLGFSVESLLIFICGSLLLDKYIRWYALVILIFAGLRFCFFDSYSNVGELQQLLLIYGPIACAFLEYGIYRKLSRKSLIPEPEAWIPKFLFFAAVSVLAFAIVMYVQRIWITLSLAVVGISALLWGARISDKYIRIYSLLLLAFAAVRFSVIDGYYGVNTFFQWVLILVKLGFVYAAYFIYRALYKKSRLGEEEKLFVSPLFYASSFLLVLVILKYIRSIWISVSLGTVGVLLFLTGFLIKEKVFRHGGFIIFGITLARVAFVDLAGLPIIYKIISFIIIGILFLGVSFIYTKYTIEKQKK